MVIACAQENIIHDGRNGISIDSISPSQGIVGTLVHLYGKGFSIDPEENSVTVNGVKAKVLDPAALSALRIEIPVGAKTGKINLKVNEQQVAGPTFTILLPPVFAEMKPTSGYEGTVVTLLGNNLKQVKTVSFNGVTASINKQDEERIEVKAPASTTGPVVLDYGYGQIEAGVFTFLPDPPVFREMRPNSGYEGTNVIITGSNLKGVKSVLFNGIAATITLQQDGQLEVKAPASTTGNVVLDYGNGQLQIGQFTYLPPVFREMKPASGFAGTVVTITGIGLGQVKSVLFNGVAASINVKEHERLEVKAPASTTGNVVLEYGDAKITAALFTYLPIPFIADVMDGQKGLELSAAYINPVVSALKVTYNGATADIVAIYGESGNTAKVLAEYPADDIANPFDVILSSNGIQSLPFRYTIRPLIDRIAYDIVSNTQTTITYDIAIYGRYFGDTTQGNSATITMVSRLPSPVPNTIQSWTPTKVVTRVTVDIFWSIGGQGAYRDYYGEITVNGVISNQIKL